MPPFTKHILKRNKGGVHRLFNSQAFKLKVAQLFFKRHQTGDLVKVVKLFLNHALGQALQQARRCPVLRQEPSLEIRLFPRLRPHFCICFSSRFSVLGRLNLLLEDVPAFFVKSRGSLKVPIPKHCGTLFLVPHCCVWVLEPSGESTAQAVPLHYNCVRTLGSYLAVMFNTPPSKLGNDFPKSELVSKLLSLRKQTAKH